MNIVHVIAGIDPAKGGPSAVAARLAAATAGLGHTVDLVAYARSDAEERVATALAGLPDWPKVRTHFLRDPDRLEGLSARAARRRLDPLIRAADMVHVHGVWEPILRQACRIAERHGVPYCILPHGMLDTWSLSQKRLKKKLALFLGYRRMIDRAAFIHALNRDESDLIRLLNFTSPLVIVPNGVFLDEIDVVSLPGAFSRTVDGLGENPYVLFLSRLHYKKGLDYLAASFAMLAAADQDVHLVVAGPDEGAREGFERSIAESGLGSRVHVVGPLYGREKYAALRDSACFCLPSRQEGFSVVITEALACGVPVVISEGCHFPEVQSSGAGAVVPLDAAAIAVALRSFLSDGRKAAAAGRAGRAMIERSFVWQKIAAELVRAYGLARSGPGTLIHRAGMVSAASEG